MIHTLPVTAELAERLRRRALPHVEPSIWENALREGAVWQRSDADGLLYGWNAKICGKEGLVLCGSGANAECVGQICQQAEGKGAAFVIARPETPEARQALARNGFVAKPQARLVRRPVRRNLWSQAEFDAVTARQLEELRQKYCPKSVRLPLPVVIAALSELYAQGLTIVSNEEGYALYFVKENTLRVIEIQAEGERAAEILLEAAREKEVLVEQAEITVLECQDTLFLGEGKRTDYAMVRLLEKGIYPDEIHFRCLTGLE